MENVRREMEDMGWKMEVCLIFGHLSISSIFYNT